MSPLQFPQVFLHQQRHFHSCDAIELRTRTRTCLQGYDHCIPYGQEALVIRLSPLHPGYVSTVCAFATASSHIAAIRAESCEAMVDCGGVWSRGRARYAVVLILSINDPCRYQLELWAEKDEERVSKQQRDRESDEVFGVGLGAWSSGCHHLFDQWRYGKHLQHAAPGHSCSRWALVGLCSTAILICGGSCIPSGCVPVTSHLACRST